MIAWCLLVGLDEMYGFGHRAGEAANHRPPALMVASRVTTPLPKRNFQCRMLPDPEPQLLGLFDERFVHDCELRQPL
jgi:hypothetical protein